MMGMDSIHSDKLSTKDIYISNIKQAVIDGNTYYFIVSLENEIYQLKASVNPSIAVFIQQGEVYSVKYYNDGTINIIESIDYPRAIEGDVGV